MDRCAGKKESEKVTKLGLISTCIFFISLWSSIIYAEDNKDENKIEFEKMEIIGVLERPAAIFPIRWKNPERPEEMTYELKRSFKEEIFDFLDMDAIEKQKKIAK
ncbi:MAG: hypothetical protein A2Y48_03160 [Nitrospirae bacterium RIFCSPLOW2_12_42_9]|nr:MAG: hypothetical protein A2Z60_01445 [Nitrospirae bacterium RIFCSPLOWO2_02_42_7]OGW59779.1 MAG: hypothetical protein A2Y48_03160 [Nitrospirae bacterium RIFCSPLOW2_12_42_9]HKZ57875.1 hypothetical protein [Thermodesulfovibrionales bacterium]